MEIPCKNKVIVSYRIVSYRIPFRANKQIKIYTATQTSVKKKGKKINLQVFKTTKLDLPGAKKASVRVLERYLLFESKRPISSWQLRTRENIRKLVYLSAVGLTQGLTQNWFHIWEEVKWRGRYIGKQTREAER